MCWYMSSIEIVVLFGNSRTSTIAQVKMKLLSTPSGFRVSVRVFTHTVPPLKAQDVTFDEIMLPHYITVDLFSFYWKDIL